jgi:PAS domain S-box-containing protein
MRQSPTQQWGGVGALVPEALMDPTTTTATTDSRWQRLAWLPIPVLLAAIAVLWVADPRTSYESRALLALTNVVFTWLASLCIGFVAGRSFLASGQPGLIMLGCGAMFWGFATPLAGALIDRGGNVSITIHNLGVFASGVCHLGGLLWRGRTAHAGRWLAAGYAGALLAVALLVWAAITGWTPVFFVQGQGGTLLRQVVLGSAIGMLAVTAWLMLSTHRRQPSGFLYYYALGLALLAAGLGGVWLQTVHGSALGWTGRITQCVGGAYLFIAAMAAARETGGWKTSLAAVEEAWRKGELLPALRKQPLLWGVLRYAFAVAVVAAGFGFRASVTAWIGPGLPTFVTFYPAVMVAAVLGGFGPGILATLATVLLVDYWILPPVGQFTVSSPVDRVGLVIFSCMGLFVSTVADLYRRSREKAVAYDQDLALRETRQENEFLANLLAHAEQPFAVGFPDGRIDRLNHAFEQLTGYSAAELRALDWSATLTAPEWREMEKRQLDELNRTGQPVRYEKEYVRKDGSRVPIELLVHLARDAEGRPDYYYSFLTDITARKRAEEAASRSRKEIEELVERSPFGTYVVDAQFRISMMNASSQEGAFRNVRPVIGRDFCEAMRILWPEAVAVEIIGHFRHTLDTGDPYYSRDFINPRHDAEIVEAYEWQLHRMTLPDGQYGVICYYYDSTKLREAEQARRESEERFRALFENMQDGFAHCEMVFDEEGRPVDFIYLNVNAAFGRLTGLENVVGRRVTEVLPGICEAHPELLEFYGRVARTGQPDRLEIEFKPLDAWLTVAAYSPQPGQFAAVFDDITARRQAEEKSRASEKRFRSIAENLSEGLMLFDPQGNLIYQNPASLRIHGFSAQEDGRIAHENLRATWQAWDDQGRPIPFDAWPVSRVFRGERFQNQVLHVLRSETGLEFDASYNGCPIHDASGKLVLGFITIREISEQRKAEVALCKSEERLRLALQSSGAGVWDWEIETGGLEWSPELFQLFGLDPANSKASFETWRTVLHPADRQMAEERITVAVRDRVPLRNEYRIVWPTGEERWILSIGETTCDASGKPWRMMGICLDITARKQAETVLRESETQLRLAINAANLGTWDYNPVTGALDWDARCKELFGLPPEAEVNYDTFLTSLHPEDREGVNQVVQRTFDPASGGLFDIEYRTAGLREGGVMRWVRATGLTSFNDAGKAIRFIGTVQDITERKQAEEARRQRAEEALRMSEQEFRSLAEAMPQIVWATRPDGWNIYFNQQWVDYTGMTMEESYGHGWNTPFHPDDKQRAWDAWQRATQHNDRYSLECRLRRADGVYRWWLIRGEPMRGANGEILKWFGTCTDIEEIKNAEAALREANQMLEQRVAERTAALAESAERLRLAQQGARLGAFEWNVQTNVNVWSPELEAMYGLAPGEFGKTQPAWEHLVHPEDRAAAVGLVNQTFETGEPVEGEWRVIWRDGSVHWIAGRFQAFKGAAGKPLRLSGVNMDITARKQAEEAVRESEARFRQTLESIPGMVFTTRPDGYCDYQSQQWVDFTGVPMSEHLGDGWNKLLHPDDRPRAYAAWRSAVEGRSPYDLEYRVRRQDGEYEWFKVIGRPISDSEGRIVRWFGTALNIQDLVVARAALEESEARYRLLVEQTVDGIFVADAQGHYQDVNTAGAAMLGYTREEICQLNLADVLAAEEVARLPAAVAAYSGGAVVRSEWRFRRKDGSHFPGEVMGRQLPDGRLQGILRDITERKEAEEALRESERLYRAIGESIDYGIWICDAQGRNIYASESLLKLVGITKEQCKDFGWGNMLHPDDAEATTAAWKQCVQTGGSWYREHRYRGVDGQWHPILACGVPVRDERGEIRHWAGINLDISRLKQAEERLKSSLREKEVLLKEIHHRVKNNLQVIASLVDLQAEGMRESGLLEMFADIRDRVRSMALVHEKLYQSESLARVDFADYMQSLLGYLSRSHGKPESAIELKSDLQPVALSVGKAVPCGLIVNELVSNAYKHAFRGRAKGEIRTGLGMSPNGRVWLRVGDNGVGLPAGMDWRQSRSLGLRLIQLLAGQLHATVDVRTDCGTEFEIAFELEKPLERA